MSAQLSLQARVEQYLAERRRGGFELSTVGYALASFARHVQAAGHHGPLTVDLMAAWARQAKSGHGDRAKAHDGESDDRDEDRKVLHGTQPQRT